MVDHSVVFDNKLSHLNLWLWEKHKNSSRNLKMVNEKNGKTQCGARTMNSRNPFPLDHCYKTD